MSHIENTQRLVEEIERLKLAIEAAFKEGFDWGYELGEYGDDPSQTEPWEQSQAKKDAEGTQ
jgi:hypothetical protein